MAKEHIHRVKYLTPNKIGLPNEPYVSLIMGRTVIIHPEMCRKAGCQGV